MQSIAPDNWLIVILAIVPPSTLSPLIWSSANVNVPVDTSTSPVTWLACKLVTWLLDDTVNGAVPVATFDINVLAVKSPVTSIFPPASKVFILNVPVVTLISPLLLASAVVVPNTNLPSLSSQPINALFSSPLFIKTPESFDGAPVVPFDNSIKLSWITVFVVDIVVVEPSTVKLPFTVTESSKVADLSSKRVNTVANEFEDEPVAPPSAVWKIILPPAPVPVPWPALIVRFVPVSSVPETDSVLIVVSVKFPPKTILLLNVAFPASDISKTRASMGLPSSSPAIVKLASSCATFKVILSDDSVIVNSFPLEPSVNPVNIGFCSVPNPRIVLEAATSLAVIKLTIGAVDELVPPLAIGKTFVTFVVKSIEPANIPFVTPNALTDIVFPDEPLYVVSESNCNEELSTVKSFKLLPSDTPLIVLFDSFPFAIEPANIAFVTVV